MEPVTIGLAIASIFGIVVKVVSWIKTYTEINARVLVPLPIVSKTSSPATISKLESQNSKDFSPSYHSNDDKSSSNSDVLFPLIFIFVLVLGTMAFVIYRKQRQLKENYSRFQRTERQIDSPASSPTLTVV